MQYMVTNSDTTDSPNWHALHAQMALARLESSPSGLTEDEVARRLGIHGLNTLPEAAREHPFKRILLQFNNLLIYVLLVAAALSASIGHVTDAALILAVVLVNAVIGFLQEGQAERALDAIHSMIEPRANVMRDGVRISIQADRLAPGDIVLLDPGDRVPADLRLIKVSGLLIDEAPLTGESIPSDKSVVAGTGAEGVADRKQMAFSGTTVAAGQGVGVVVATGASTELGRIGAMLQGVGRLSTPLLRQMNKLAWQVTLAVIGISVLVFFYALYVQSYTPGDALMAVVGLAVASIPEGLPVVVTITLAVGVRRMARRNAIIRHLPAVETLGSISTICSDKTGTLTKNEMLAGTVVTSEHQLSVDGEGYQPVGTFRTVSGEIVEASADPVIAELTLAGILCNDADIRSSGRTWVSEGDPMEGALISLGMKAGHSARARATRPRLAEIPFDSRSQYMATLHEMGEGNSVVYVKGSPERVLAMCGGTASSHGDVAIDVDLWLSKVASLGHRGERVIAVATKIIAADRDSLEPADINSGLTFLGLVGLIDPPRPEAIAAIAECRTAGIRVKMITGDHAATARAIALQLGLADDPIALTGYELDALGGEAFKRHAREATVFARTTPEHKMDLVEALQADGSVIAMTGDGVNDAPALNKADVGVAMGGKGTDAAKAASQVVLADDNFASIVEAIREGRTVYENLLKVIAWTLPTNGGAALTIIIAIVLGLSLPVTPAQILWVNMITAVALGLTLAFEPTQPDVMRRPPRNPTLPLLTNRLLWQVAFVSGLMVAGTFAAYSWAIQQGLSEAIARTMSVNALVYMEIFYLFNVRVGGSGKYATTFLRAPAIVLAGVVSTIVAQLAYTYLPAIHAVFDSRPLDTSQWAIVVAIGLIFFAVVEVEKRLTSEFTTPAKKQRASADAAEQAAR